MFSWQSKYRSADAKNELENTFNGIATDSDVAIYWFKMIKNLFSSLNELFGICKYNATYHDTQDTGHEEGSIFEF